MANNLMISEAGGVEAADSAAIDTYSFEHTTKDFKIFTKTELKDSWLKWGLDKYSTATFRITGKRFDHEEVQAFLLDLLNSQQVRGSFTLRDRKGNPQAMAGKVTNITFEEIKCTATTMDMFDAFLDAGVVAGIPEADEDDEDAAVGPPKGGYIRRKMDEDIEGVTVGDLLKDSLLNPYSDRPVDSILDPDGAQKELLYRIFKWISTGGGSCQPEEYWGPYLEATKGLYRDLTTVVKDPSNGDLSVASRAYAITAIRGNYETASGASVPGQGGASGAESKTRDLPLFPTDVPYNVLWVVVDPVKRTATLFYSAFIPFW